MTARPSKAVGAPRSTGAMRIADYLAEMFPPLVYIPAALANFAAIYFGVQALAGRDRLEWTWRAAAGAATTLLFFLVLRVYDELKDVETDLRLGRAGDPRYKDRPIVTGRIRVEDLRALRWWITALLWLLNLPLGFPLPLLVFVVVFLLTWLSFHWFFWPAMSRYLLVAFATHNPLALAIGAYAAAVAARDHGSAGPAGPLIVLLIGMWTAAAAWETSRKIRHRPDETDYVTYSKVLGPRVAAFLPAFFVLVSAGSLIYIAAQTRLPWAYQAAVAAAAALLIAACIRFELYPSTASANLRPYAELYSLVAYAGLPVALIYRFSVRFTPVP
jgi:4-hydroxybenzoate polyprenyltransferase